MLKSLAEETDDFYCEHLGVVRLKPWSSGHVVLIGDAAHYPTPMIGSGVTSSLVGAYILGGEIVTHCGGAGTNNGLAVALKTYDEKFRPFMTHVQHGISSKKGWLSWLGDLVKMTHSGI